MDFGALPPEINSGRMYLGPGPGSLLTAAAGWDSLSAEWTDAASRYETVIASLTDESWLGPASMSMAAAVMPYIAWMTAIAEHCAQTATQATAAAAAFETAYAMTVPPPLIAANRARLLALIQTNIFGQNTPAIMATEAEYSEMWAQDATAMYNYAASSSSASALSALPPPPHTTNPAAATSQLGAVMQAAATRSGSGVQTTTTQVASSAPQVLQGLSTPGSSSSAGLSQAVMGTGASLGSSGASAPLSSLSGMTGAPTKSAAKSASAGAGVANSALALAPTAANGATDLTGAVAGEAAGFGADGAGLAADAGGIGIDLYGLDLDYQGLNLDYQGLALDYEGAGSILGAEGRGIEGLSSLGGAAGPLAGLGQGASASVGQASSLSTLSVPPSWATTVSSVTPLQALNPGAAPGGWAPAPSMSPGTTVSKLPLGGMVGRESEGAVQRVGMRVSLIPHSPVAG